MIALTGPPGKTAADLDSRASTLQSRAAPPRPLVPGGGAVGSRRDPESQDAAVSEPRRPDTQAELANERTYLAWLRTRAGPGGRRRGRRAAPSGRGHHLGQAVDRGLAHPRRSPDGGSGAVALAAGRPCRACGKSYPPADARLPGGGGHCLEWPGHDRAAAPRRRRVNEPPALLGARHLSGRPLWDDPREHVRLGEHQQADQAGQRDEWKNT